MEVPSLEDYEQPNPPVPPTPNIIQLPQAHEGRAATSPTGAAIQMASQREGIPDAMSPELAVMDHTVKRA